MFDTCLILAGGRGERLRPLTDSLPKPLIPIGSFPFIQYQIEYLRQYGIHNFIILSGYKHQAFDSLCHFYSTQSHIRVLNFPTPENCLTLERISLALDHIHGDFLIIYGDNYMEVDISSLYRTYLSYPNRPTCASVLAPRRALSNSSPRLFIDNPTLYNPYHHVRPCPTDIGFSVVTLIIFPL